MNQGDPQVVAAPIFVVGSIALALQLVQYVSPVSVGTPVPIILLGTGLFLLVCTIWAAALGQSFVACFCGTFGGFWLSYGVLVLGLIHGWFGIPPGDVQHTIVIFAVSWAAFFLFITLASIRLPVIYTAIFGLVVVALCLVAAAYVMTPVSENLLKAAGVVIFAFAALGMSLSWTVMNLSVGGPQWPPLGRPIVRAKG